MIIDFRVRPPYKGYLTTFNFRKATPPADPTRESIFSIGKRPNVSAIEGSIALFMREMDATGTERAVIMGRKAFLAKRLSLFFALDKIRHRLNQQGICGPLAGCRQIAEPGPQVTRQSHADSAGGENS